MQLRRRSLADSRYFLTFCTAHRLPGLTDARVAARLIAFVKESDATGDTLTFAFTTMPDHVHWTLQLGERLALGQVVAKFKSLTRPFLAARTLGWQRNYYDHELRPDDSVEDYALYVFLNPYRAKLLPADQSWAGWWSGAPVSLRFIAQLNANGSPPPEWIVQPVPDGLAVGE